MSITTFGSNHPVCQPLETYQADYVGERYERKRHLGDWYELAFRDLYPAPPHSDCQHTRKYAVSETEYDELFRFDVDYFGTTMPSSATIAMRDTNVSLVVDQVNTQVNVSNFTVPDIM